MKSNGTARIVVTDNSKTEPLLMTTKQPRARRMAAVLIHGLIAEWLAFMRRLPSQGFASNAEAGTTMIVLGQ